MRRIDFFIVLLISGWLAGNTFAETFKLANGESVTGELLAGVANDQGVKIKVAEGEYQAVPWANFSQEDLKQFAANPKLQSFVEPYIEITQEEKIKKTEVNIKQPPRWERPARQSLLGAFFSSGLGVFILLVLYAANIYAGYEVAIFRIRPPGLVCGLAAVPFLGLLAPIVFLALPGTVSPSAEAPAAAPEPTAVATAAEALNPMKAAGAEHPAGLRVAHTEPEPAKPDHPATVKFQRGQFTFNRRFFETKFPGFFGVVKREADRDMVLVLKSARGEYVGQRISRIAANDLHLQVQRGQASEEVMIPFQEIQEIRLKHRNAPD